MMIFTHPSLPDDFKQVVARIIDLRKEFGFSTSDNMNRWWSPLARMAAARAMVGTNSIEGINVTLDDAVAVIDGEAPATAQKEDKTALQGYWNAMTYIVQLSKDPAYIHNENTLKSLHYMMLGYDLSKNPGRWRPGGIHIANTASNTVVYEGPGADLVPQLMGELTAYLNQPEAQPLIKAAMAHLNLAMIHPFSDGNGRMARALQTMVLSREGILDPRFSSIEEYIGHNSAAYYAVLAEVGQGAWHPERDPLPWIRFCLTAHYRQADNLLRRQSDMGRLWKALEDEVKRRKIHARVVNALVDAAIGLRVKNPTYRNLAGISNQTAKYDLKRLADEGLLVPKGERKGRYYVAGELVQQLRNETRSKRRVTDPFEEPPAAFDSTPEALS
ncbi:MAG: Fic family protein [Betaproteobacteria bacterium]|nr:Fic family protein [Betaproteobacteria bacterium]